MMPISILDLLAYLGLCSRQGGTSTRVDKWSAGCQVIANNNDWHEFLDICYEAKAIWGNNFTYTLIESNDIT